MKMSDQIIARLERGAEKREQTPDSVGVTFYRLKVPHDCAQLELLLQSNPGCEVHDTIADQLFELAKVRKPHIPPKMLNAQEEVKHLLNGSALHEYGVWVYYPWSNRLVHLLDEEEFVELRTSRNLYKITREEQALLRTKKIGVIGLSVGMTIALCLAMERVCGEIRIADFDTLDLSNLNRLEAGVHHIGTPKWSIALRRIAELDPFLQVRVFTSGVTEENMDDFLTQNGKLDVLVDECDSLDIKLLCRMKAKEMRIPVVMDTNDRGMLDIERFDLEPDRPILHGLAGDVSYAQFTSLTIEDKVPFILKIIGSEDVSPKGKASMIEVGQSIPTWPQLSSSVYLGGGITADICRRILLKQLSTSGRFYVDPEKIIADTNLGYANDDNILNKTKPLTFDEMLKCVHSLAPSEPCVFFPSHEQLKAAIEAACKAPSTGNDQPWVWLSTNNRLFLFHDRSRTESFGDFDEIASNISLGAAYENLHLKCLEFDITSCCRLFPLGYKSPLTAEVTFSKGAQKTEIKLLGQYIDSRNTNRNPSRADEIPPEELSAIQTAAQTVEGANLLWLTEEKKIKEVGHVIGVCDKIRVLNQNGHKDLVQREMRWTPEEAEEEKTGIDIRTLGLNASQLSALKILRDEDAVMHLKRIGGGSAFIKIAADVVKSASGLGCIILPSYSPENFFHGGRAMQRTWLKCTQLNWAVHPLISPFYLFPRILHGAGAGLDQQEQDELWQERKRLKNVLPLDDKQAEVFLFKIGKANPVEYTTCRLPLESVFFSYHP